MANQIDPRLYYMKKKRKKIEIVLEDLDFIWDRAELSEMKQMWEEGKTIYDMAYRFDRKEEEVFLALLHLSRHGRITKRLGGVF